MTNPLKTERVLMGWEKVLLALTSPLWITFVALYWVSYALFGKNQMMAYRQRSWEPR